MKMVLRYMPFFIMMAIICTAFVHYPYMLDGIANAKSAWFYFWIGLFLIFSVAQFASKDFRFDTNRIDLVVSLFLMHTILNNTFHDPILFSRKNIEIFGLLLFYFLAKRIYTDKNFNYRSYLSFILLLTLAQIVIAALQWFEIMPSYNYNFKFTGFFFNPAPFAIYLSTLVVLCLAIFLFNDDKIIKIIALILFLLGIPIILITLSRAAWLGAFGGAFFVLVTRFKFFITQQKPIGTSVRIIIALVIIAIALYTPHYLYNLKKDSADGRLLIWKLSFEMIQDHYVTGVGNGNFPASLLKQQSQYFYHHPEQMSTEGQLAGETWFAFNDVLQIFAELGVIGFLLTIVLFVVIVKVSARLIKITKPRSTCNSKDSLIIGTIATLLVIFISGMFSYPLTLLSFQILFYNSLSMLSANSDKLSEPNMNYSIIVNKKAKSAVIIICVATGLYFSWYGVKLFQGYNKWYYVEKENFGNEEILKLDIEYPILQEDSWLTIMKGKYYFDNGEYDKAITILELAKRSCSSKNLYFALGACYESEGKFDKAEQQYKFLRMACLGYYDQGTCLQNFIIKPDRH